MKISFIICYSSTWPMTVFDKESWPEIDVNLDKKILSNTNLLIKQILNFNNIDKEVILIDNSNDFKTDIIDKNLKVVKGIADTLSTYNELSTDNQAEITAKAYNIGIEQASGDYFILQHNDTYYLEDFTDFKFFFRDIIKYLNDNKLEYITIDAKPSKSPRPEENYFADCYWFLCKNDFYKKHNIYVDWELGDNNHMATIVCNEKNLPYLHLPGFYEINLHQDYLESLKKNYPRLGRLSHNIHSFAGVPFLLHFKGGTGLSNFIKKDDFIY